MIRRPGRRLALVFGTAAMSIAATPGAALAWAPSAPVDHTHAINVNPPGENGLVPATDTGWQSYAVNGGYPYDESQPNFGYPSAHMVDQIEDLYRSVLAKRRGVAAG